MTTTVKDVLVHAARNPKFRERLKNDPKKVLAEECDLHFFHNTSLIVEEAEPNTVYFILPELNNIADLELELKKNPKHPLLQINLRALKDPLFLKQLRADPKAVLIEEYKAPLPSHFSVKLLAQNLKRQYLLLPNITHESLLSQLELTEINSKTSKDLIGFFPLLFISASEQLTPEIKKAADALSLWIQKG